MSRERVEVGYKTYIRMLIWYKFYPNAPFIFYFITGPRTFSSDKK